MHSPRQIHGVGVRQRNRTRTAPGVGALADARLASEFSGGGASGAAAVAGGLVTACTTTYERPCKLTLTCFECDTYATFDGLRTQRSLR
jgi:hypothetical protein